MSWQATNWAVAQKTGDVGRKAVLLILADKADEVHSCFPGQQTLADATEQSVSTIKRQLKALEASGFIRREHRPLKGAGVGRGRTSDRYYLAVDGIFEVPLDQGVNLTGRSEPDQGVIEDGPRGQTEPTKGSPVTYEPSVEPPGEPSATTPPPAGAVAGEGQGHFGPHQPHPGTEKACCLVAAWYDGAKDREAEEGVKPFPTIAKRMRGQATNVAKDLSNSEEWATALQGAYYAGCQGLWDLAQGVPVSRKRVPSAATVEQDAIFGPSAQRARERMAAREQAAYDAQLELESGVHEGEGRP